MSDMRDPTEPVLGKHMLPPINGIDIDGTKIYQRVQKVGEKNTEGLRNVNKPTAAKSVSGICLPLTSLPLLPHHLQTTPTHLPVTRRASCMV